MKESNSDRDQLIYDLVRMSATGNTPPEWRESVKLGLAGVLALGCWSLLGWVLASQFLSSRVTAEKIEAARDSTQVALIKDAHEVVDRTASSIYSLLTPVATAITGYFFVSSGSPGNTSGKVNSQNTLPNEDQPTNALQAETPPVINSSIGQETRL
jgi:hypothetical protein